jgi:two-component system OmpR family response regulator
MMGNKILLVDDEEEFARTLAERLEARGLRVDVAFSGEEALEKAKKKNFDAIILDLAMPGMDGIDTLKEFRAINPDLQIIILTGHATVQKGIEAMKLGAVDLMEKPAELVDLLAKIEEASSKKALLVEKQIGEQLKDILGKKGW